MLSQETGSVQERSLQSLEKNYNNFLLSGGDIKIVQYYFIIIHPPMLDMDIHFSSPYLHILLDYIVRNHKLWEQDPIQIDKKIVEEKSQTIRGD